MKLDKNGKYRKREVQKNLKQLKSAKHRLLRTNVSIELENPRRGKEIFDPKSITEVYLISALLGKGEDYYSPVEEIENNNYIHTFTREFTEIVLNELDTIQDFINYLKEKEIYLNLYKSLIVMGGEEELLAYYLMHERKFDFPPSDTVIFDGGFWDELNKRPEYQEKKRLDKISYGWDELINIAHTSGKEYVYVAKELARPDRFHRRILSKSFLDAHILARAHISVAPPISEAGSAKAPHSVPQNEGVPKGVS